MLYAKFGNERYGGLGGVSEVHAFVVLGKLKKAGIGNKQAELVSQVTPGASAMNPNKVQMSIQHSQRKNAWISRVNRDGSWCKPAFQTQYSARKK